MDYSALLSNYLSGRMQFKGADGLGRFSVINSTDPGQHVSFNVFLSQICCLCVYTFDISFILYFI